MQTTLRWLSAPLLSVLIPVASYGQGVQMNANTRMEVNLGVPVLAEWTGSPSTYVTWNDYNHYETERQAFIRSCAAGKSVRACWQEILSKYRQQGVTGVRVMFDLVHVIDGPAWETGLRNLFADLNAAQIYNVTPTIGWSMANWVSPHAYQIVYSPPPVPGDACTTYPSPAQMRFSPTAPFGEACKSGCTANPEDGHYDIDGVDLPHGYKCSPPNTYNFVGWPAIYSAIGTVLQAARDNGLTVEELDGQNEIMLNLYAVRARLIVDNTHGNEDVLGGLRGLMSAKGFDPARVTYSTGGSRTANPPSGGVAWDCGSYYGDSARILGVSEISAAIAGAEFGDTNGNWGCAYDDYGNPLPGSGCGMKCEGDDGFMESLPLAHSQPKIIDIHFTPCRRTADNGECDPSQWDEVPLEAAQGFNDLHHFQKSVYPQWFCQTYFPGDPHCGWRGYEANLANSVLMLGESHGHALVPALQTPENTNTQCEMLPDRPGQFWDVRAGRNTAVGFNQSTLPYRSLPDGSLLWVIFRPWEYLQQITTPPDPYYCNAGALDSMHVPSQR